MKKFNIKEWQDEFNKKPINEWNIPIDAKLKSDIGKKWTDTRTINSDLKEFIGMAMRGGGPDLVEDIRTSLLVAASYAKKSIKTFKTSQ